MQLQYPFIQVAGVMSEEDMNTIIDSGAKYIGFPLALGYHAEDISREQVRNLVIKMPAQVKPILITYLDKAEECLKLLCFTGIQIIQLHGAITPEELKKLRQIAPEIIIIKSLIIGRDDEQIYNIIERLSPFVDAFITDTYDPATGACGATGLMHNPDISREIVLRSKRPVILAGGLRPDNVAEAICRVRPFGVDCHTGVEGADGLKSAAKTKAFVQQSKLALKTNEARDE